VEEAPWEQKYLAGTSIRSSVALKKPCAILLIGPVAELPPITASERIDAIGNMSSRAIIEASETTANDIQKAGEAAVEIAVELLKEAKNWPRSYARPAKR
jgi:hypothetical protein